MSFKLAKTVKMAVGSNNNFYFYYVNKQKHKQFYNTYLLLQHSNMFRYLSIIIRDLFVCYSCKLVTLCIIEFYKRTLYTLSIIFTIVPKIVGMRPLASWDRGFESHREHGCLSVVSVLCCQVEVSATSWSLVQRSPTDCGASLYVI